ncbi:MAG: hypothetical protein U5R31_01060 [Acidimicrobiia bacterium]|nr:hypothetical protein [Acidimicrobiia bacterium]
MDQVGPVAVDDLAGLHPPDRRDVGVRVHQVSIRSREEDPDGCGLCDGTELGFTRGENVDRPSAVGHVLGHAHDRRVRALLVLEPMGRHPDPALAVVADDTELVVERPAGGAHVGREVTDAGEVLVVHDGVPTVAEGVVACEAELLRERVVDVDGSSLAVADEDPDRVPGRRDAGTGRRQRWRDGTVASPPAARRPVA